MADPQVELGARLAAAIVDAFGDEWAGVDPVVRQSDFGDYQANVAMGLGKTLGRAPRDVAAQIVAHVDVGDICETAQVSGPGFVNLTLRDDWIASRASELLADVRLGVSPATRPETIVVDYSAPNVAKEMHVGHLRTTIIGDALTRVLGFLGHRVIRQNHIGDWGTPFGMLIEHLVDVGEGQAAAELSTGELTAFYQQASAKFKADEAFADRARRRVVALQRGEPATLRLWLVLVKGSERYFTTVYERLGVLLTRADSDPESFYNPALPEVAAELQAAGLATVSEGALCAFPPGFSSRDGRPLPLIIQKRDGGYGYSATDLAAVRFRVRELGAGRLVYVVGAPQALHFAMVFAVARQAGWLDSERGRAEHVACGSVLGTDGKMLRTRSGRPVKLAALLDEAVERAAEFLAARAELSSETQAAVARAAGIGAIKYADLSYHRERDYVFDWERMLSLDGNTAPYLQYANARIHSIFRRAGSDPGEIASIQLVPGHPAERALALRLLGFDNAVWNTADTLEPHRLCTYLHELATDFTGFYERCPVLGAEQESVTRSRLGLCALTSRILEKGLDLLGIEAPQEM